MKAFIGNTDHDWFNYLDSLDPAPVDINFWRPGDTAFKAIQPGGYFFFRLKSPIHKIGGFGIFTQFSALPISIAWEYFEQGNGHDTFEEFQSAIQHYRRNLKKPIETDPTIGCIVLSNPVFFHPNDFLEVPDDWPMNVVGGKRYDIYHPEMKLLIEDAERLAASYQHSGTMAMDIVPNPASENRFVRREITTRMGQGGFRATVLECYNRQCCVTGERALPTLEAAHIRKHSKSGPHDPDNGILLRADLHKLYDAGYLSLTTEHRLKVSPKLKEDFKADENYFQFDGKRILLPFSPRNYPNPAYINWHLENIYRK